MIVTKKVRKEQEAKALREKMIQHLESAGWQKCEGHDAWKRRHWKEAILNHKWEMTFGEWEPQIVGRQSVWELVEKRRELDPEGFFVARLKDAYKQQLKFDALAA